MRSFLYSSAIISIALLIGCGSDTASVAPKSDVKANKVTKKKPPAELTTNEADLLLKQKAPVAKPVATKPQGNTATSTPHLKTTTSQQDQAMPKPILAGKVNFRVDGGKNFVTFRSKEKNSCKLYDGKEKELCKFYFSGKKLKAKSPDGKAMFELKPKGEKVMLKNGDGTKELFKFKIKNDKIDFYLPGEKRVYRIKKKDYGWRLEDNHEKSLFRVKQKGTKMLLRDMNDKTVLYSKDMGTPLSLIFFQIKELSVEQQSACAVFFMKN